MPKSESPSTEVAKSESSGAEVAKNESSRSDRNHTQVQSLVVKSESSSAEVAKSELSSAEVAKAQRPEVRHTRRHKGQKRGIPENTKARSEACQKQVRRRPEEVPKKTIRRWGPSLIIVINDIVIVVERRRTDSS